MDVGGLEWEQGRRAWQELIGNLPKLDADPDSGAEGSLDALSQISTVRRLLDQAELVSVKTARSHSRSWAEIATRLGISRQSAWERWRDLDESAADVDEPVSKSRGGRGRARPKAAALDSTVRELAAKVRRTRPAEELFDTPDITGLSCAEATAILQAQGWVGLCHTAGGAPLRLTAEMTGTVVDQVPKAGAARRAGSSITVWIENGGGSAGDREPRRPEPSPRSAATDPAPNL
jgi:biotin operon repressor